MRSDAFIAEHIVQPSAQAGMSVQNPYCIRYAVDGRMMARQGAMVAYRGDLTIKTQSQGVGRLIKRAVTREGLALMEVAGRGDMWLADLAKNVFILALAPGDGLSVTGKSVLCFDPSLQYDISLVKGASALGRTRRPPAYEDSYRSPRDLAISAMNGGEQEPISLTSPKLSKTHSGPASVSSPGDSGWPKTAMAPASLIQAVWPPSSATCQPSMISAPPLP